MLFCICGKDFKLFTMNLQRNEDKRMRRNWIARGVRMALFIALTCAVLGFIVMNLWNWLVPSVFGWHSITFWQALGLLVLSKILFGGFRGGAACGTPEQIVEKLGALRDKGMTYGIFYFPEAAYDRSGIEQFEREVVPALR